MSVFGLGKLINNITYQLSADRAVLRVEIKTEEKWTLQNAEIMNAVFLWCNSPVLICPALATKYIHICYSRNSACGLRILYIARFSILLAVLHLGFALRYFYKFAAITVLFIREAEISYFCSLYPRNTINSIPLLARLSYRLHGCWILSTAFTMWTSSVSVYLAIKYSLKSDGNIYLAELEENFKSSCHTVLLKWISHLRNR